MIQICGCEAVHAVYSNIAFSFILLNVTISKNVLVEVVKINYTYICIYMYILWNVPDFVL